MSVSRRGADGTLHTFPDGMSTDSIRFAMTAYNNRENMGGWAEKIARAAGQEMREPQRAPAPGGAELGRESQRNGALDVLGKLWGLPNTALGLAAAAPSYAAGKMMGTDPYFTLGDNALQLHNSPLNIQRRAYTLGNVQIYPQGKEYGPDGFGPSYTGAKVRTGDHEEGHTYQSQALGPLYLPAEIVGSFFGDKNPLEVNADAHALKKRRSGAR